MFWLELSTVELRAKQKPLSGTARDCPLGVFALELLELPIGGPMAQEGAGYSNVPLDMRQRTGDLGSPQCPREDSKRNWDQDYSKG